MTKRHAGAMAVAAATLASVPGAMANSISWVEWNASTSTTVTGSDSATGLAVTASYGLKGNALWEPFNNISISDPSWNFNNSVMKAWGIRQFTGLYQTTANFDFTNAGGLAAGGSVAILDVEATGNTIRLTGYQWDGSAYQEVAVNWSYTYYTIDPTAGAPIWNGSTNTLEGGGTLVSGWSMFSMLTSDVQLDRISFDMSISGGDGFGIGVTQANIAASAVPGTGLAGLASIGLAGLARRRRR